MNFVHPDTVLVRISQIDLESYNFGEFFLNSLTMKLDLQVNINEVSGTVNHQLYFKAVQKKV